MSLYLRVMVGGARYLLEAERIIAIAESGDRGGARKAAIVDLRQLFRAPKDGLGASIVVEQTSGDAAELRVDRVEHLVDLADGDFCPLPPIGAAGAMIDAITTGLIGGRPALRLRGERALPLVVSDQD